MHTRHSRLHWHWHRQSWQIFVRHVLSPASISQQIGAMIHYGNSIRHPLSSIFDLFMFDNRWVYCQFFIANGNFKADHVRQWFTPDPRLPEGAGMISKQEDYQESLHTVVERLTVCQMHLMPYIGKGISNNSLCPSQKAPCNQFWAIELAMLGSKACDITSIVTIACAWHGCFAPNSIADLFRGEQQNNIDWVLLQALQWTHMDPVTSQTRLRLYSDPNPFLKPTHISRHITSHVFSDTPQTRTLPGHPRTYTR